MPQYALMTAADALSDHISTAQRQLVAMSDAMSKFPVSNIRKKVWAPQPIEVC